MANKQLTAKVRINSSQAEQKLRNIARAIDAINRATGKQTNAYNQVNSALNNTVRIKAKVKSKTDETTKSTKKWSSAISEVNSKLNGSSRSVGMISSKLKGLASTYLGVMGMKAIIGTTDTITSAENKLNYVSAQQLGASGTNADGSYSQATFNATQNAMDKMYVSSQKVRMGYEDMMNNVSKSMALAGDAFDNNTDKAIRFQEIMAEAYAVGGASAQEMSSSMYQMIQALGSGTLAGDELRSVREGAPLAYQAIEKFAQGVYGTTDSLKDMASQGKITSDMVVSAVMNAGNEMDSAFAQTEQTFAQTWNQIKNVAVKAFEPVAKMIRTELNKAIDNGLVEKASVVFNAIAKGIMIAFALIKKVIVWIADNWGWLQHIIVGALILMITYMLIKAGVAVVCAVKEFIAFMRANAAMMTQLVAIGLIVAGLLLLLYVIYLWKTGAIDTCKAIGWAVLALGLIIIGVLIAVGVIATAGALLIALAIVALLVLAIMFFEKVCYGAAWLAAWIVNILSWIWNGIVYVIQVILAIIFGAIGVILNIIAFLVNVIIFVINLIIGIVAWLVVTIINIVIGCINAILQILFALVEPFLGIIEFILNCCNNGFNSFGGAVANLIGQIISWFLTLGKVVTTIIDAIFGTDWTAGLSSLQDKVLSWGKSENAITIERDVMPEIPRLDATDAFSAGYGLVGYWDEVKSPEYAADMGWELGGVLHTGYADANEWGTTAGDWGAGLKDKINAWGSQFQNTGDANGKTSLLDRIGEKLGLDFSNFGLSNIADRLGDGGLGDWLDNLGNNVGDIADNTGSIADSMEVADEDLEYLRKIAEMEWKKEYTTANITLDMTNYNTVNGESDLDSIVTKLADKLYEEMNVVANGVYVY